MLGQWSSHMAAGQRQTCPTSTIQIENPRNVTATVTNQRRKSFKDIMRECYWRREQAHRAQDKDAQQLAALRRIERTRLFGTDGARPEIYVDNVISIGERDSRHTYPALGLDEGDVVSDPKLRYLHPSLRHHF